MNRKNIKIGVIFDQHAGVGGGYQQSINAALLANKLSNDSIDLIYFTTFKENIKLLSTFGIKAHLLNISFIDKFFSSFKRILNHPRLLRIFKSFFKHTKFEKIILDHDIDLVYFLSPSNLAQDLDETNFIITVWDLNHRYNNEFPEIRNTSFIEFLEKFYSQTLRKASSIIVDSEMSKDDINKYYSIDKERIFVIPFQPSISVINRDLKSESTDIKKKYNLNLPYIFYPAQFWAHKNHVYILEGIKILEKKFNKKIGAIFSGSNQGNINHVKNEVKRLGLEDRIRFAGFVDDKEIPDLYLNSIALVMPTFFGPTNIPPLEAFNLGIPVLYSDLPGLKDQVEDAALLIDLKNADTMANHINNLLENKELRNEYIKRGRDRSDHFNKIDRYSILRSAIYNFQLKKICWNSSTRNLEDVIFVVDSSFSALMVNNIIKKENISNPRVIIEIKQGIHRFDGFENSIKDMLSSHNIFYEKIVTVPSPFYVYIKEDGLINKIKKLINWKKIILQTYKPEKNIKYIGSTSSSLMKVISQTNSYLFDDGASSYISHQSYNIRTYEKLKNYMSYLFFKIIKLDNMRFKNTRYSAFPFKEQGNIINLSKNTTPSKIKNFLDKYKVHNKKIAFVLCVSTHQIFKELPIYKKKYNNLNIELIKKHCSKDELIFLKFHQVVFGSDKSEQDLIIELKKLGYQVKNVDDFFPGYLKSRVPAEIIVNHYSIQKIISSGSSVNFNYANLPEIKNIIDLGVFKNSQNGKYSLSENEEYTNILADLYGKLNKIALNQINIYY